MGKQERKGKKQKGMETSQKRNKGRKINKGKGEKGRQDGRKEAGKKERKQTEPLCVWQWTTNVLFRCWTLTIVTRNRFPSLTSRWSQRVTQADTGGSDGWAGFWSHTHRKRSIKHTHLCRRSLGVLALTLQFNTIAPCCFLDPLLWSCCDAAGASITSACVVLLVMGCVSSVSSFNLHYAKTMTAPMGSLRLLISLCSTLKETLVCFPANTSLPPTPTPTHPPREWITESMQLTKQDYICNHTSAAAAAADPGPGTNICLLPSSNLSLKTPRRNKTSVFLHLWVYRRKTHKNNDAAERFHLSVVFLLSSTQLMYRLTLPWQVTDKH